MKDETTCKKEVEIMKIVRGELGNIKQDLRRMIQEGAYGGMKRSYSEAVKGKKKENVIIIKPKMQ